MKTLDDELFDIYCKDGKTIIGSLREIYEKGRADTISEIITLCDDYRASGHNFDVEKYLREQLKG